MGPSGSGKTTLAKMLAQALNWNFVEGDDLHPAENLRKMAAGKPLTDEDRLPFVKRGRKRDGEQRARRGKLLRADKVPPRDFAAACREHIVRLAGSR